MRIEDRRRLQCRRLVPTILPRVNSVRCRGPFMQSSQLESQTHRSIPRANAEFLLDGNNLSNYPYLHFFYLNRFPISVNSVYVQPSIPH